MSWLYLQQYTVEGYRYNEGIPVFKDCIRLNDIKSYALRFFIGNKHSGSNDTAVTWFDPYFCNNSYNNKVESELLKMMI